jgi:hypothetical protein
LAGDALIGGERVSGLRELGLRSCERASRMAPRLGKGCDRDLVLL